MRSHWPTAISTEPPCTQLTPSSANEHVENADTRGAEIAQNEPLPIDPLENGIGAERKLLFEVSCFRFCPFPAIARSPNGAAGMDSRHSFLSDNNGKISLKYLMSDFVGSGEVSEQNSTSVRVWR